MYICVVAMSTCPSISCTLLRFAPPESRCVAKQCLRVCTVRFFGSEVLAAYFFTILQMSMRSSGRPVLERNRLSLLNGLASFWRPVSGSSR